MKGLFTGFLSISLSGSLILCLVLLFRLVFRKAPKTLICILWALAILRLLLPFQIETPFSLRPETPVLTTYDTLFFAEPEPVSTDALPDFVPREEAGLGVGLRKVLVDYVMIAGCVWSVIACGLLLYMIISYLRLKRSVKTAILTEKGVYEGAGLSTAFLLGYFRPRIYLPTNIGGRERELVVAHERMHRKRGDNWLKLFAFVCLSLHWFNPLVWISYRLLCKDVEDACDEMVIRNLDEEDRKVYSSALLSCGQGKISVAACPVAFGEISIKQRILNVLNYKKPTLWFCVVVVIAIVLTGMLFMTDPYTEKYPPYYNELTQMLGQPMDDVLAELGLSEESIVTDHSSDHGKTTLQVEWQGITFNLYLMDDGRGGDKLAYFGYLATYEDLDRAAEDTVKLSRYFWKRYGLGQEMGQDQRKPERLAHITVEEVREMFNNPRRYHVGISSLGDMWDITDQAGKAAKSYLKEFEASEAWQKTYGPQGEYKDENAKLQWSLRFSAHSDADPDSEEETARAYISLTYKTSARWDPQGNVVEVLEQEQSWWDKFWAWFG